MQNFCTIKLRYISVNLFVYYCITVSVLATSMCSSWTKTSMACRTETDSRNSQRDKITWALSLKFDLYRWLKITRKKFFPTQIVHVKNCTRKLWFHPKRVKLAHLHTKLRQLFEPQDWSNYRKQLSECFHDYLVRYVSNYCTSFVVELPNNTH